MGNTPSGKDRKRQGDPDAPEMAVPGRTCTIGAMRVPLAFELRRLPEDIDKAVAARVEGAYRVN